MQSSLIQEVTLVLNGEEVEWLRGLMQNPLSDDPNPANEDDRDKQMRTTFYLALGGGIAPDRTAPLGGSNEKL